MANMERLSPLPNNKGFLVIWHRADEDMYDTLGSFKQELIQDGDISSDGDLTDVDDDVLDTVCYKCVGVTRDRSYQKALKAACEQLDTGNDVDVQLVPEPNNPFDSKAIQFQC